MSQLSQVQVEPTWAIAELFPPQGLWSEDEYLDLQMNRLIEYSDGFVEVLPMPTTSHQLIVACLYRMLLEYVAVRGLGTVLFAPLRVRLWPRKFREPDVVFMFKTHAERVREEFWIGADLVMEVVSGEGNAEDRRRDLVTKREEYARAKIGEYWIVDPREATITVLRLAGKQYVVHGQFARGTVATSHLLSGFVARVNDVLASVPGRHARGSGDRDLRLAARSTRRSRFRLRTG